MSVFQPTSHNVRWNLLADDTILFMKEMSVKETALKLESVSAWFRYNKLIMSLDKNCYTILVDVWIVMSYHY